MLVQRTAMPNNEKQTERVCRCFVQVEEQTTGLIFNGSRVSKEILDVQNRLPTESG